MPTRTRPIHRLKARALDTITKPGRHGDGGNLYLSVSPSGARSWVLLYRWHGKLTPKSGWVHCAKYRSRAPASLPRKRASKSPMARTPV